MTLRIGISARLLHKPPPGLGLPTKRLQFLESNMAHWIMGHGVVALMIPFIDQRLPTLRKRPPLRDLVEQLDGLVLQGGADVSPRFYGAQPCTECGECDSIRDEYELELLRGFVEAGKPVLGICRGMQLINVAYGGTLYQDLQADGATQALHVRREIYDEHVHGLRLAPGSALARCYGDRATARVNSIHHQGVKALGRGLVAEAWSEDGVVEAIRRDDAGFVLGVQWHPEFHDQRFPALLPADPLMQAFLDAARARRGA